MVIKDLINKTAFAMATDETRKNLNGCFIRSGNGMGRIIYCGW